MTELSLLRIGDHVINLSYIRHVWFGEDEAYGGEQVTDIAYIDYGGRDDVAWDLVLTGDEARQLREYFDV